MNIYFWTHSLQFIRPLPFRKQQDMSTMSIWCISRKNWISPLTVQLVWPGICMEFSCYILSFYFALKTASKLAKFQCFLRVYNKPVINSFTHSLVTQSAATFHFKFLFAICGTKKELSDQKLSVKCECIWD